MPNYKTSKNLYLGKDPFGRSADHVGAKTLAIYIYIHTHTHTHTHSSRSQWPRGLRRRSAAANLLRS